MVESLGYRLLNDPVRENRKDKTRKNIRKLTYLAVSKFRDLMLWNRGNF